MSRVAALAFVVLAVAAAPATGHAVNYASMDPQRTADGTVVVEAVYLEAPGWVALVAEGKPVGHARVDRALTTVTDVRVPVADGAWPENGTLRVRPRLYADDGDGTFEPGEDRRLVLFGAGSATTVARGGATARVLAERAGPLELKGGAVPVRSVALPADGYVVVATTDGERLGSQALSAGTHANVSVPVARSRLPANGSVPVAVSAVVDDGDGELGAADRVVRAGGARVRSVVELSVGGGTAVGGDDSVVTTPSPTPSPPSDRTATGQFGFGLPAPALALLAFALTALARRRV